MKICVLVACSAASLCATSSNAQSILGAEQASHIDGAGRSDPQPPSHDPEIIVTTARITREQALEAPVAVSVLQGEFFEQSDAVRLSDLTPYVAGLEFTPTASSRVSSLKIRGISTFSFSEGFEASTATLVDGVILGREAQSFFDLTDVDAIEVLKGPQGTVFGKNASAGVVSVQTRDPQFDYKASGKLTLGTYDTVRASGHVTGPVTNAIAFRLSAIHHAHSGYLRNQIPGEKDLNDKDSFAVRGKLLFAPYNSWSALLTADYSEDSSHCCSPTFRAAANYAPLLDFALNPAARQLGDALDIYNVEPGPENRSVAVPYANNFQRQIAQGLSLRIENEVLGEDMTLISAWRDWGIDELSEPDQIQSSAINDLASTSIESWQVSHELRMQGEAGKAWQYVAGLFYLHQSLESDALALIQLSLPFPPYFNNRVIAQNTVDTTSMAAFGEVTFDVSRNASIIIGGRYSHEKIDATFSRNNQAIIEAQPFGTVFGPDYSGKQKVSDKRLSGRVIGRLFVAEDVMTYLSWTRGYKGPGVDVAVTADASAVETVGGLPVLPAEIPTMWELGLKGRLLEGLQFNVAAFDQALNDFQTVQLDASGFLTNLSVDKLRSRGVELEASVTPSVVQGLSLTLSAAFLDTEIETFTARPDLQGEPFRDNPRWTYSLIGHYRSSLSRAIAGKLTAEIHGRSSKNTSTQLEPFADVAGFDIVNVRLGIGPSGGRWEFGAAATNLFNKRYTHFVYASPFRLFDQQSSNQFVGDPRLFSVSFKTQL